MKTSAAFAVAIALATLVRGAHGQITTEVLSANGVDVPQQKFSLECPDLDERDGTDQTSTFTVHLLDTRKLPRGTTPRVQGHGYYAWNAHPPAWHAFTAIDENTIGLSAISTGTMVGIMSGKDYWDCVTIRRWLDRNSLELVIEVDVERSGERLHCRTRLRNETRRNKCVLVPYKAPPERIGF